MIERGDKREEYRENTRYWKTRLIDTVIYDEGDEETESPVFIFFKDYDAVCFSYGYTRRRMLWECKGVDFGRGRPEWGAPDHETFIIKLGNRLNDERMQERFTGSRSAANASSIGIAKSRPYENTSPKLLAVPCVPKRISCSTSVSPQTNRDDLPNSRRTECRSWRNTATPSRWRNSFAPLTGYCRRSTRPGHAADAGSARTAKYNISSTCDAIIPNYGQNWSS